MTPEEPPRAGRRSSVRSSGASHVEVRDETIQLVVSVALQRGDRVLVIREEDEPDHRSWVFPQGYPQPGETLAEAARREAFEEIGLDVELDGILGVYEHFSDRPSGSLLHRVTVCYRAHAVQDLTPRASREAIDSVWIDPRSVEPGAMPALRPALEDLGRALGPPGRRGRRSSDDRAGPTRP